MTDYVLGVDIGSGSVKLTLLSREGEDRCHRRL